MWMVKDILRLGKWLRGIGFMRCPGCNEELRKQVFPPVKQGKSIPYCSFPCWSTHCRRMNSYPCMECRKMCYRSPHHYARIKSGWIFCSYTCRAKFMSGKNHHRYNSEERICEGCHKVMLVWAKSNRHFCSMTCRSKVIRGKRHPSWEKRYKKPCSFCGKVIRGLV